MNGPFDEIDDRNRKAGVRALREDWGDEFQENLNAIKWLLSERYLGMFDVIMTARTHDHMKLGDDPTVLKMLAMIAKILKSEGL